MLKQIQGEIIMEHYTLQSNEVILYKGEARCPTLKDSIIELFLTNLFIVLIIKTKKLFSKEEVRVETYPVGQVKMYNGIPQAKQNATNVELFLLDGEQILQFQSRNDAHKFVNCIFELLTGKNAFERGVEKTKNAVNKVDTALEIDTVGSVKNIFEKGIGGILGKGKIGKTLKTIFNVSNSVASGIEKKEPQKNSSPQEQMNAISQWKALLDQGIITEEEFTIKKKEILGM